MNGDARRTPPDATPRRLYEPPTDDDAPLDLVERAIVRALVPVLVERIRATLVAEPPARRQLKTGTSRTQS